MPAKQLHTALACRLMASTPVIHVITWITTHFLIQEG